MLNLVKVLWIPTILIGEYSLLKFQLSDLLRWSCRLPVWDNLIEWRSVCKREKNVQREEKENADERCLHLLIHKSFFLFWSLEKLFVVWHRMCLWWYWRNLRWISIQSEGEERKLKLHLINPLFVCCSFSSHSLLLHRLSKRKISAVWGKRLIKSWGKRSESDSDELYQHLLRELHHTARFNQLAHPRYSSYNDCKLIGKEKTSSLCSLWCISSVCFSVDPLTLERLLAQRPTWNNDNDNTAENLS